MTKGKSVPAPAATKLTAEDFVKAYNQLCEKYKFRLSATPIWKLRDDGTFSLIIQYGVEEIVETK